ncbi:MAG: hypothetical protein A3B23_02175 [Candidatus Colwellbacteria bacterium RIFCSPLOWO2_01_FULL_48_10]|uniref:Addiction module toxin RelE n=1 Tax=Candidatus Colwellbacteria bacterium RIFCSPLOWO2_01_FULL_48_10 TaxID=1797690 RepID=A0A1G1Z5P4_9BACT|nr:MAG: hypothetical protein A3B23_02175 [Candidatus Colwellbacteria bacterium RIFCSPLOWO2_01_FULL_48_10]
MEIEYHRNFKKTFRKRDKKIQSRFFERLSVFMENQFHYSLNNHALTGKFKGVRSFDITGDVRVHYEQVGDVIVLINIGTHSELY